MTKRLQRLLVTVGALAALALGGSVLAQAQTSPSQTSPSSPPERTSVPDRDNVQAGDQTSPDTPTKALAGRAHHRALHVTARGTETAGAETPETGAGSESAPGNDGPGGHADEPGNANVDHSFQGNE
jgi:hypothetical protein